MRQVLLGLSAGGCVLFYFFGWGVVWQLLLAISSALLAEAWILHLRGKAVMPSLLDGSAVITAVLLALAIPSIAPWWLVVVGSVFAIVFGKQLYGGLGHNPFNPAMLGYVFLLLAYPLEMTQWQAPVFLSFSQAISLVFATSPIDAFTAATVLDRNYSLDTTTQNASVWFWVNSAFLLGGVYLLIKKVIFWQLPVAMLVGLIITATLLSLVGSDYQSAWFHLFSGATMMAAFFIVTDPVSGATTPKGRLVYGAGIGILIVVIRELSGNYPDGVAFAVLLMNILVPLIDKATKPKPLGGA